MSRFSRIEGLIGVDGQKRLEGSNVLIVGVGGVGGYVCEMLVRSGVRNITVIDPDKVEITNCNRQIIALSSTLGMPKVEAVSHRMSDINPDVCVRALELRYCEQCESNVFDGQEYDYCVDAIDSVKDKVSLILACKRRGVPCISALGAGNRTEPSFEVMDIFSTSGDGLARAVRCALRKAGVKEHKSVCTLSLPETNCVPPASISYVPAIMGCIIAREVIKDLLCR